MYKLFLYTWHRYLSTGVFDTSPSFSFNIKDKPGNLTGSCGVYMIVDNND
jgi:hypothetical protein